MPVDEQELLPLTLAELKDLRNVVKLLQQNDKGFLTLLVSIELACKEDFIGTVCFIQQYYPNELKKFIFDYLRLRYDR